MTQNSIDIHFQAYLDGLVRIDILVSRIRSTIENAHRVADANRAVAVSNGKELKDIHLINHLYRDISTGKPIFFGSANKDHDEEERDLIWTRNKLYQFALVEAFEIFESFVKAVYAVFKPLIDPASSIAKDSDLSKKLHILRKHIVALSILEQRNAAKLNYRSAIAMIECFRHIIVHRSGRIQDKEKFLHRLRSKIQKHNEGIVDNDMERECLFFIVERDNHLEVILLEHFDRDLKLVHVDRLQHLIDILSSYAGCLAKLSSETLRKHISIAP